MRAAPKPSLAREERSVSFTLRSLLLAFVVIASAPGTFGPVGLFVGIAIVATIAFLRTRPHSALEWLVAFVIVMFLIELFLPAVQTAREASRRVQCANNLKQIALALHNYEQQYGCFPPAYVPGPDGKPWHSWRVLILPFIESQPTYDSYRFDEPWDGPNNRKLAASPPYQVYVCPTSRTLRTGSGATSYLAVVGPKTAWPGPKSRKIDEIRDGTSNTILVVEAHGLGIHWMEPRDLDFDAVAGSDGRDPKIVGTVAHPYEPGLFFIAEGGAINVAFADGSVYAIPWGVPGEALTPLLTADGGDDADPDALPFTYQPRLNWPRCLSLAVLVVSTLLLWWSTRPRSDVRPGPQVVVQDSTPSDG